MSQSKIANLKSKIRLYWPLIKSLQTGLLVSTGMAGYMSARCPIFNLGTLAGLFISLTGFHQRQYHSQHVVGPRHRRQNGTHPKTSAGLRRHRPQGSPAGGPGAFDTGGWTGSGDRCALRPDHLCRACSSMWSSTTIWLKRRTCWGIVWGGISGGMPILAGRALGLGSIDWIGILLSRLAFCSGSPLTS